MASRTRNRVLWIAALGIAAATLLVVLISHDGARSPVTPLREEMTGAKPRGGGNGGDRGLVTPGSLSADRGSRPADRLGSGGTKARDVTKPDLIKHEGIRPVVSLSPRVHRRALPPSTPATPVVRPIPFAPSTPPTPPQPAHSEAVAHQPTAPEPMPTSHQVGIEILDGDLRGDLDDVKPDGGHLTLHIRSDELVIVEIDDDDDELRRPIPAGGEAQITLEASSKRLKMKLVRRKGVLVLRVDY